ncbi:MAG: DUF922 domain-containing Zn-dependent protease [Pseudomonadota bacterium]|nr:DUF922 domain-containing Zn-dependent protease [Pseudomonadota bacterium]
MALIGWPKTIDWTVFGAPLAAVPSSYGGSHTDCHIEIAFDYSWHGTRRVRPGGDYQLSDVKVIVKIDHLDTWVLAGVAKAVNQARVLKHEQGHYNIAGITARDVDRALSALRNADSSALEAEASSVADAIIAAGQAEEDTYDDDSANGGTDHGNDFTQQATWNSQIAAAKSLAGLP